MGPLNKIRFGGNLMNFRSTRIRSFAFAFGAMVVIALVFQNCSGQFKTSKEVQDALLSQNGGSAEPPPPAPAPTPGPVAEAPKLGVSVATNYACYLNLQGLISCSGYPTGYNFGQMLPFARNVSLIRVPGVTNVKSLSTGLPNCALHRDGTVTCWSVASPPAAVPGLTGVKSVNAGQNFACAHTSDDKVVCWGSNTNGALGNPAAGASSATPIEVPGVTGVKSLFGSATSTCVITQADKVLCWGNNYRNLLTYPQTTTTPALTSPIESPTMSNIGAKMVVHGGNFMCALTGQKTVRCWGTNGLGQLGNGQLTLDPNAIVAPADVFEINNAVAISAWRNGACALLADGKVKCWGEANYGALGTRGQPSPVPLEVLNLPNNVVSLSGGADLMCALTLDQKVYCWGDHINGATALGAVRGVDYVPTLSFIAGDI